MPESDEVSEMWKEHGGDDSTISYNWSINIGQIKKAIADLPDDYELMVTCSDVDDCEIAETHIDSVYPPSLGSPGLLVLTTGQTVTSDYAFHARMDAYHSTGSGVLLWSEEKQEWYNLHDQSS